MLGESSAGDFETHLESRYAGGLEGSL
jgi:hypothetical protein